jgi:membrane fusion protein (multidrug efflux system)
VAEPVKEKKLPRKRGKLVRFAVLIAIVAVLAVAGLYLWRYFNTYETTDDAQVDGHIDAISARINGNVIEVLAEDEQYVKAGDVLVRIDPKDYEVVLAKTEADLADAQAAVADAQAAVADAKAALETSRFDIPITNANTSSQLKTANSGRVDATAYQRGAERQLNAAQARLESSHAQVREAEANLTRANDDVHRYKLLVDKQEIPRQQYDTAVSAAAAAQATLDARKAAVAEAEQNVVVAQSVLDQAAQRITQADASIASAMTAPQQVAASESRTKSAQAQVEQRQAQIAQRQAQIAQRKALVDQAKLNLSYCTIVAPVTGIVGKKTVELGENVSPGQQLMAVVPLDDVWITANFKETQLGRMSPGQRVKFTVDALGKEYTGKIQAIGGASGSRFSLLPPENATGNYVKVVQRIPVRINLDPGQNDDRRLRPGMSVDPTVYFE